MHSRRKEWILRRYSRKWCSGRPGTKIRTIQHLSGKSERTRNYFWPRCDNAGLKRSQLPLPTPQVSADPCQIIDELIQRPLEAPLLRFETGFEGHSDRSASVTLTRAARAAGSADATTAAASSTTTDATTGRLPGICTSSKELRARRIRTYPDAAPATTPAVAITAPSAMTLARSWRGCAPIASRMPNSRVRALTDNATTPPTPTSAIASATAATTPNITVLRRTGVRTSART